MPIWNSITVSIEPSGALSIVTLGDIDPGHEIECRYTLFDEEPVSVLIREIQSGNVVSDNSRTGTLRDVPAHAVDEARGWISGTIVSTPDGSALEAALQRHARRLAERSTA